MTLLEAIYKELEKANRPLTAMELEDRLRSHVTYRNKSSNFITSIRARVYEKAKAETNASIVVLAPNTFGLTEWVEQGRYQIYETSEKEQHKKHLDEVIAVVPIEHLRTLMETDGFQPMPIPFMWIRENCIPMVRRDAENSYEYVQLISSFLIVYKNEVLSHVRTGYAPESRLKGEKSILLGGHIAFNEISGFVSDQNFDLFEQEKLVKRELYEEVEFSSMHDVLYKGCLYDSSRDVSSQHLSLVHQVIVNDKQLSIRERGYHRKPEWVPINELITHADDFENWSIEIIHNLMDIYRNE